MTWVRSAFAVAGLAVVLAGCGAAAPSKTTAPPKATAAPAGTSTSRAGVIGATAVVNTPISIARTAAGPVGYREVGAGSPILLVMGLGGSMDDWQPAFVAGLAAHHRVVVFDNAGIGKTGTLPSPLGITGMANQASALISALGLGRTAVLGCRSCLRLPCR